MNSILENFILDKVQWHCVIDIQQILIRLIVVVENENKPYRMKPSNLKVCFVLKYQNINQSIIQGVICNYFNYIATQRPKKLQQRDKFKILLWK